MVRLPPPAPALQRALRSQPRDPAPPLEPEELTLRDGSTIRIARVTPADAPVLADGFARLSAESRRLRFLAVKPNLSRAELRYLTEVDGHHHEALGAIDPVTGDGVAIARFVRDDADPTRAEVAVTVADQWQGRGVGKLLLGRLTERARAEGVTCFTALVSSDNRAMHALMDSIGGPARLTGEVSQAAEYEIPLGPGGLGGQLEAALRAAARGHWHLPPQLWEALKALVPIPIQRR